MRRLPFLLAAVLAAAPAHVDAQYSGGFVAGGRGEPGTALHRPNFTLYAGYLAELSEGSGPWLAARYGLGLYSVKANADGYAAVYGPGTLVGGDATVTDTGFDVQAGWAAGPVRAYGLIGIHYLSQSQEETLYTTGGEEYDVTPRGRYTLTGARGVGVELIVVGNNGFFAEYYHTGSDDGVMKLEGMRFGLRYAW
ncbi:MAG TPA: hypothetical protein VNP72_05485 [Longimicrobium sp.]|nr:hypothetical protein [Longimicrobium sp.]